PSFTNVFRMVPMRGTPMGIADHELTDGDSEDSKSVVFDSTPYPVLDVPRSVSQQSRVYSNDIEDNDPPPPPPRPRLYVEIDDNDQMIPEVDQDFNLMIQYELPD